MKSYKHFLENIKLDLVDKNNIHSIWEYLKNHISKEDVENMVNEIRKSSPSITDENFIYGFAISRVITNLTGGGETEALLRIENDLAKYLGYTFETQLDKLEKEGYPSKIPPLDLREKKFKRVLK